MGTQTTINRKSVSSFNWRTVEMYLFALLLGGTAGWGYWWTAQSRLNSATKVMPVSVINLSDALSSVPTNPFTQFVVPADAQPQLYWLTVDVGQDVGQILMSPQSPRLDLKGTSEIILTSVMDDLLAASIDLDEAFTAIPRGTQLLDLRVEPEGIYIDLSKEFAAGGGASSMIHRVGQVLYTVTSLDPDAAVYFSVAGQPVDENAPLGGEGLILQQPVTREAFAKAFSF